MHDLLPIAGVLLAFLLLMNAARRLPVPPPVTLVFGGLALGFLPGLPHLALDPALVLFVFLPPVLFWEATLASWRDLRQHLRPIALLAVGLVLVTMAAVAVVAHALIPGLPWAAAFVLGAVVAPTDPVALLAIAQRVALPRWVVDVLVGESLVNDATALVALRLAVAAVATGGFAAGPAAAALAYVAAVGVAVGLATAGAIAQLRRHARRDALHDNLDQLLTPFGAYLAAELLGASGVLAAVAAGLYVGARQPARASSHARLQGGALWEMLVFALNGLLFVLIGLQLHAILGRPLALPPLALLGIGLVVTAVVIAARLLFVFPAIFLARKLGPAAEPGPPAAHVWLLGWTGMRGGVSLAAALGVPALLADGAPFPGRHEILMIGYVVILATLALQGLTLPVLIRWLGIEADAEEARAEAHARLELALAALRRLDQLALAHDVPPDLLAGLHAHHAERAERLHARRAVRPDARLEARAQLHLGLRAQILEAERATLQALRAQEAIGERVWHRLQAELDREALQLAGPPVPPPGG